MTVKKRFIAGAVCPRCDAMDRIVMYVEEDKQFRECVACGFQDAIRLSHPGREPETRVNRSREEKAGEVRPVKIIDP